MQLYNTPHRAKEALTPLKGGQVGLYSCGPTVYDYAHIGNLRTYIFVDMLKKALAYRGYEVKHVMNITDVGHLTNDSDVGEDKMLLAALREQKSVWDIAEYFTQVFKEHLHLLNIAEPTTWCKATDSIPEQIALIETLEQKGFTYRTSDGIYFDTAHFPRYAAFAGLVLDEQKAGARVESSDEKRQPWDFALWKFSPDAAKEEEKRQMEWESPWGVGFPGWHIECSAMARTFLGQPFDIHTGGIDHVPIHHTNEVAQSEAAYDTPLANIWMHGEFLTINAARMGKSQGNFITLQTLIDEGYDPLAYRFFCLNAHYRQVLNFTWEALDAAAAGLKSLKVKVRTIREGLEKDAAGTARSQEVVNDLVQATMQQFTDALADDLAMPRALALVFSLLDRVAHEPDMGAKDYRAIYDTIIQMDAVLGLDLDKEVYVEIPAVVRTLADQRLAVRVAKDWAESDRLRDEIRMYGFDIEDGAEGYTLVPRDTTTRQQQ